MEPEEIYGPGVQAVTINIRDGCRCRTHPGGPSVRARVEPDRCRWCENTHTEDQFAGDARTHTESQFSCLLHIRC